MRNYLILLILSLSLCGCGMIPVPGLGLLVDNEQPSIFIIKLDSCDKIAEILSKKLTIVDQPEEADYLVYLLASPVALYVDIIDKNGLVSGTTYQPVAVDVSGLIARYITRTIRSMAGMPPITRAREVSI